MARATRSVWAKRVKRWRASGLTAREFAARECCNRRTLAWWSSRLGREERPAFVEVTGLVDATQREAMLEVVVRDGVRVRVARGFDAELLRSVVAALEAR